MPRKNLVLFLAVLLATALGVSRAFSDDKYYDEMRTLARIAHEVMGHYVTETESQKLFEGAYRGMLATLDPYSQYFNESQTRTFGEDTEGKFGGLGIEISLQEGLLYVVSPIRGTPAYEAGIQAGDVILKIDGKSTERITLGEALKTLRGKPGTEVVLTIRHRMSARDEDITITRAIIKPPSVEYEMIDEETSIGFIRVASFTDRIMKEMNTAVADLQKQNVRGLILDLRQNPGGLLDKCVEMADLFIAEGAIVSVKGRRPEQARKYNARKGDALESLPLVLLIDEGSASASEIVAAAIRDHKRGILIGARTYGKGSVQNIIPLGDNASIKLTTARYYTPSDKPIEDRQGIMPDILVPMSRDHLIALRNQEREDKLRNNYHFRSLIEETPPPDVAPGKDKEETKPEAKESTTKTAPQRRERIIDHQLKAACTILKWQLNGQLQTETTK